MGIIPSQRFYGLLIGAGAIVTLLASLFPTLIGLALALELLLVLDGILIILAIGDGLRARGQRVTVERRPLERLSIGRQNTVTLVVQSPKQWVGQVPLSLKVQDTPPPSFTTSSLPLQMGLSGDQTQELSYSVYPDRRGVFPWRAIHLQQEGPWRLAWHRWTVPQAQTVAVYPDLIGLRSLSVRLALQSTGTLRRAKRLGTGTEFAELRDYGTGDDPRLIDWKATARRGQPLVRVLEPEQEQTLIILLDRGRLMTAQVEGLSRFDWGLNATLALALAGLNRGDRVGVGVFDRQMHTWIPPQRGQHHLFHLLERLTPIQPVLLEADYPSAVSMVVTQQNRRALVVVITDIVDATASIELLSALARLRPRYLPLCVTLSDPHVNQRAESSRANSSHGQSSRAKHPDIDIATAYTRAVALDLLTQRQVAFGQLRQKGVLVLDAPANQISEPLVEQYLQIKAKNQL